MFTKEEIEDIEVIYRSFCGDGRVLTDLELSIMKKLKAWVDDANVLHGTTTENLYKSLDSCL